MITRSNANFEGNGPLDKSGTAKPRVVPPKFRNERELIDNQARFRDYLSKLKLDLGENPIDVFLNELKQADVKPAFDNKLESLFILFIIMDEFDILIKKQPPDFDVNVKNVIQLMRRENTRQMFARITQRLRVIKKLNDDFKFAIPKGTFVLQKLGQSLKGIVLRDCYLTQEAFGQIRDRKTGEMVKPNLFKSQFVEVQFKKEVLDRLRSEKEGRKSDNGKQTFPWPDKKELSQFTCRLLFREAARQGRERAVYMHNQNEAHFMKKNAIFRRLISIDANIKLKILPLKAIRMVKMAEYFYVHHLQKFLSLENLEERIKAENDMIRKFARDYAKIYYPSLPEAPVEQPYQLYHFHDNSHLIFKKNNDKIEREIDLDETKRQMATMIQPDLLANQSSDELFYKNKVDLLYSPFEKLDHPHVIEQKEVDEYLKALRIIKRVPNSENPGMQKFIQQIVNNSQFLLRFKKILIPNYIRLNEKMVDDTEYEEMLFAVEAKLLDEGITSKSNSFLNEIGINYVSFEIRNSLKVTWDSLRDIKFKLSDKLTGVLLFEGSLNLQHLIDNVYLENPLFYEIQITHKGNTYPAIIYCTVAFLPKNLETAHITLNKELIDLNFNKFIDILKKSETYNDYRQLFFSKAYIDGKINKFNFDLFFNLNNHLNMSNVILHQQENLFANSFIGESLMSLTGIFKRVFFSKLGLSDLCHGLAIQLTTNEKLGTYPSLDLLSRVCDLLNVKERLMIHKMLYDFGNSKFFGPIPKIEQWQYQNSAIETVSRAIDDGVAIMGFLQPDERYLIYQICFELYLKFENNTVDSKSYKVHFSKHFVPIVARIVQLNSYELKDEDVHQIALSQIATKIHFHQYSYFNQLSNQSNLLIYFKILFKSLFTEQFKIYMNYMQSIDSLVSIWLMESLSSSMDTINYNIYQDFKAAYELVFLIQSPQIKLLDKLKSMEITFASLVDILFILNALASNVDQFEKFVKPEKFIEWVKRVIVKETYELKKNLARVLELIEFLNNASFYDSTFEFFKEVSSQHHENKSLSFMTLSMNLKKMNITTNLITEIIKNEIVNNKAFRSKAYSLYQIKLNSKTDTTQLPDIEGSEMTVQRENADLIEEDVFFDIAEDFETNHYKDLNTHNQKSLVKYNSCLIFLNNLDINLSDALVSTKDFSANFNSIFEYDHSELQNFIKQYLRIADPIRPEFISNLNVLFDNKSISLVRLIIIMICGAFDDRRTTADMLRELAEALTSIYFVNHRSTHFNWAVTFIVDQIHSLVPHFYFPDFTHNLVNISDRNLMVYVKYAKINLTTDIVDVWDLCAKHFMSYYHLNGKYGIAFNYEFCKELTVVFNDLIAKGQMPIDFHKFEIFLEMSQRGKSTYHQIAFRIAFVPETSIVCKDSKPLIFDEIVTEENLISADVLTNFYYDSPLCYLNPFSSPRNFMTFMAVPFIFEFKALDVFLKVNLSFVGQQIDRVCSNIIPWTYPNENFAALQKFTTPTLSLKLSYAMFFLKIAELYKLIAIKIIESLQGNDVFSFIKLNAERYQIITAKNKAVDTQSHLSELKEFEKALKEKTPLSLTVKYSYVKESS